MKEHAGDSCCVCRSNSSLSTRAPTWQILKKKRKKGGGGGSFSQTFYEYGRICFGFSTRSDRKLYASPCGKAVGEARRSWTTPRPPSLLPRGDAAVALLVWLGSRSCERPRATPPAIRQPTISSLPNNLLRPPAATGHHRGTRGSEEERGPGGDGADRGTCCRALE